MTMTDATPTRRRWFQFSLRTLFLAVTVVAAWLAWSLYRVHQRDATYRFLGGTGYASVYLPNNPENTAPWSSLPITWRILGAKPIVWMSLSKQRFTEEDRARIQSLFPEASVLLRD